MFSVFKKKNPGAWVAPPASILADAPTPESAPEYSGADIAKLLTSYKIPCQHVTSTFGASVARHHFNLVNMLDIKKIKTVLPALSASLRTVATQSTSDTAHFSLIIPRINRQTVHFKNALLTHSFNNMPVGASALLGTDTENTPLCVDISDMPHMLIAGATGSGKSACMNAIICSMLFKSTPASVKLVLIDPKQVEFAHYEGIPHLLKPVITDAKTAIDTLESLCKLMDERYAKIRKTGKKDIAELDLPRVVVCVDELADLMLTSGKKIEAHIVRLAQKGRAAGIHLILATQRPTVNVVTGLIKVNIPARIALSMSAYVDSRTVLDRGGAESLTGKGDALLKLPNKVDLIRFQSAYIDTQDIKAITDFWREEARIPRAS